MMTILPLADRPDTIPLLSGWFHGQWHSFDGRSRAAIEAALQHSLNRESIPITFVAITSDKVIGTVSLDESDLPPYDHLSPWLASLYVVPAFRRSGVGTALVRHTIAFAQRQTSLPVYLWTPGSTGLYETCGFKVLAQAVHAGRSITVMEWPVGSVAGQA
jgi:predicted N-acetyltransferase YhbS